MSSTKRCGKCGLTKPIEEFWITDAKRGYRRRACKDCDRETARRYYRQNDGYRERTKERSRLQPAKSSQAARRHHLKYLYSMTEDEYRGMAEAQDNKCALCGTDDPGRDGRSARHDGSRNWISQHWNVDHDHETGRVRGLLCHKCNVRVGAYEGLMADVGEDRLMRYLHPERYESAAVPFSEIEEAIAESWSGLGIDWKHYGEMRK